MAEQDRNRQHQAQPVLVFVSPQSLRQDPESAPRRQAPDWVGEILGGEPQPERMARYAKAGVGEYWRVDLGISSDGVAPARIEVHTEPQEDGSYASRAEYVGDERIHSRQFPRLELRPQDLA